MSQTMQQYIAKVFEKAVTAEEVYEAAQKTCDKCSATSLRCTGYGSCPMFPVMNMKIDAIEILGG